MFQLIYIYHYFSLFLIILLLFNSVKAIRENITCLKPLFPRIFELLKTGDCQYSTFKQDAAFEAEINNNNIAIYNIYSVKMSCKKIDDRHFEN